MSCWRRQWIRSEGSSRSYQLKLCQLNSLGSLSKAACATRMLTWKESFKSQLSFHINGAAAHFTPYNYGFSWVPSASEDEYGRLFIKADNEMGDRYWEGDLPHDLDYIVD